MALFFVKKTFLLIRPEIMFKDLAITLIAPTVVGKIVLVVLVPGQCWSIAATRGRRPRQCQRSGRAARSGGCRSA